MATKTETTKTATFELTLQNSNDDTDTVKRSISFDLPPSSTIQPEDIADIATDYFFGAGMSNVFQPSNWRDYEGLDDVYILKGITPVLTQKTVSEADYVTPE